MPTGLTDPHEDIVKAVTCEVKEETGLSNVKFQHVLCFREAHSDKNQCHLAEHSDVFFVCLVRVLDKENVEFKLQEDEILDVQWMNGNDYIKQHAWTNSLLCKEMNDVLLKALSSLESEVDSTEDNSSTSTQGFGAKMLPIGWKPGSNAMHSSKL